MSQTDRNPKSDARVGRPVVLVIDAPEAQTYLDHNQILEVLYGDQAPLRLNADMPDDLLFPLTTEKRLVRLMQRFPQLTYGQLDEFIESDEFFQAIYDHICATNLQGNSELMHGLEERRAERMGNVRVVIVNEDLFDRSTLPQLLLKHFADVAVFKVRSRGASGLPTRVSPNELATLLDPDKEDKSDEES